MVCNSKIKDETPQYDTEQYDLHAFEMQSGELWEIMCDTIKGIKFQPMMIEYVYFMCQTIKNQPQWVEKWLNWWIMMETEDFGATPTDTLENLMKQIEKRLMFAKYIKPE
jgi:hypothetical protein